MAGRDFDTAFGTLTFAPGNRRQSIAVPTREDDLDEPNETFTVRLNNAIGATLEDASATGTIIDDDVPVPPPTLSITDATVVEGETARFAVRLSPASEQTVTVSYRTVGGTAAAGQDFDAASGTLTFAPGTTRQIIAVPTQDDALDEPDETFLVTLRNPSGATLEDGSATGTIIDDDVPVPPPTLSIADATVVEGETARFAVGLSRASEQTVTVSYRTAGGTAAAGRDFDAVFGTLTFGPRTTQQVIAVPTREDKLDEPDETFLVTLSNPNGATIQDGTATGTIADDDVRSLAPINRELLPEIGRALAFTAVRCRIEQAFSDMARGWAEPVVSPSLSVPPISSGLADGDGGSLELEDILANTSFLLPLMGGNGGTIQFSTWGCGDYRSLAGDGGGDAGAWDGEAFSMQVGADAIVGRDLLAGVSLSQSRGSLDFDGPGGSDPAGGRYDLGLTGVHPYLGWWISPDLELWGTFGLAGGDLQVVDDAAGSSATSAATLASATVGINGRLLTYGAATLRLKGEGSLAQLDVSKGTGLFQGASANLQRLRLAAEVEYEHVIPDVGVLVPWGELGMRHEGGDGATGSSLELGGGLHYRNIEQGWNAEVYGRWLAVQDDAPLQEQGFGLRFRYDPETPGFGPWVSLTQTWGEPASALHRLWERRRERTDRAGLGGEAPGCGVRLRLPGVRRPRRVGALRRGESGGLRCARLPVGHARLAGIVRASEPRDRTPRAPRRVSRPQDHAAGHRPVLERILSVWIITGGGESSFRVHRARGFKDASDHSPQAARYAGPVREGTWASARPASTIWSPTEHVVSNSTRRRSGMRRSTTARATISSPGLTGAVKRSVWDK